MQSQKLKRFLVYSLLIASFAQSAASASSQERKAAPGNDELPIIKSPCPKPISLTLTANTPNVVTTDFSADQLAGPRAWLNDPAINKHFLYTFHWTNDQRCCEITQALLTVKMKANQGGVSKTSRDAGNDGIAVMLPTAVVAYSDSVYSPPGGPGWPFSAGATAVKSWSLSPAALNSLNATHNLSIYVEDDTMVTSATLQLSGCCLTTR